MNIPDLRTPRGTAIAVSAAILATVLAAFSIPPGVSGGDAATDGPGGLADSLPAALPEDLAGFIASDRGGISLEDVMDEIAGENLEPRPQADGFPGAHRSRRRHRRASRRP